MNAKRNAKQQYAVRYVGAMGIHQWYICTATSPEQAEKKCKTEFPNLRLVYHVEVWND